MGHPTLAAAAAFALLASGCIERLNAGSSRPHGLLPVDERNPMVLVNDGAFDNWQGEYAMLLANASGPRLVGIVVGTSPPWPHIDTNIAGWRDLVAAARASGLRNIPDPITSIGRPLARPATGDIDATRANRSEGALFIIDASIRLSLPHRPLVVATGGRLTDVADAYLVDPTVTDRVVVVSSLGTTSASGGAMGNPNGEMDPWADTIVAGRFRYVQVSAYYSQLMDVPPSRLSELPANTLGAWIAEKQPRIWSLPEVPIRSRSRRSRCRPSWSRWSACPPSGRSAPARPRGLILERRRTGPSGWSAKAREPSRRRASGSCS